MKKFQVSWYEGSEREFSADAVKIEGGWLHLLQELDGTTTVILLPPSIATSVEIQEIGR